MEVLKKKFDDFQKDLAANETRVDGVNSMAQKLLEEGHSEAPAIMQQIEVLFVCLNMFGSVSIYWCVSVYVHVLAVHRWQV